MSTAALTGLRDFLYSTLSPANMMWLGTQLTEHAKQEEYSLKPFTKKEVNDMIDESERQLANGQWQDFDEAMNELEKELAEKDQEPEMAEAV